MCKPCELQCKHLKFIILTKNSLKINWNKSPTQYLILLFMSNCPLHLTFFYEIYRHNLPIDNMSVIIREFHLKHLHNACKILGIQFELLINVKF